MHKLGPLTPNLVHAHYMYMHDIYLPSSIRLLISDCMSVTAMHVIGCGMHACSSVLTIGVFQEGTVPFGSAHVPFGQYHRSQM